MAAHPAAYDRLLALRPSDALLWYIRAEKHLIRREYQAAVADFARGGEPPATTEFAYIYAAALLLAGDEEAYGDTSFAKPTFTGKTTQPFTLYVLARMAMLAHDPPAPPEQIVSWSNRTLTQEPRYAWYFHAKAMAAFRAGDIETARRAIEESERRPWDAGVINDVVHSLIELRQGHAVEARKRFERAVLTLASPARHTADLRPDPASELARIPRSAAADRSAASRPRVPQQSVRAEPSNCSRAIATWCAWSRTFRFTGCTDRVSCRTSGLRQKRPVECLPVIVGKRSELPMQGQALFLEPKPRRNELIPAIVQPPLRCVHSRRLGDQVRGLGKWRVDSHGRRDNLLGILVSFA